MKIQLPSNLTGAIQSADYRKLDGGKIWFGQPHQDPKSYPVDTFLDNQLTVASPPFLRLKLGYLYHNGQIVDAYVQDNVTEISILITDVYNRQLAYLPRAGVSIECELPPIITPPPKDDTPPSDQPPPADDTPTVPDDTPNDPPTDDDTSPVDTPKDEPPPSNNPPADPPPTDGGNNDGGIDDIYKDDIPPSFGYYTDNLNAVMMLPSNVFYKYSNSVYVSDLYYGDVDKGIIWQLKNLSRVRKLKYLDKETYERNKETYQQKVFSRNEKVFYDDDFIYQKYDNGIANPSSLTLDPIFATTADEMIEHLKEFKQKVSELASFAKQGEMQKMFENHYGLDGSTINFVGVKLQAEIIDVDKQKYNALYAENLLLEHIAEGKEWVYTYEFWTDPPIVIQKDVYSGMRYQFNDEKVFELINDFFEKNSDKLVDKNKKRVQQDSGSSPPTFDETTMPAFSITAGLVFFLSSEKELDFEKPFGEGRQNYTYKKDFIYHQFFSIKIDFVLKSMTHSYFANEKLIDLIHYKPYLSK